MVGHGGGGGRPKRPRSSRLRPASLGCENTALYSAAEITDEFVSPSPKPAWVMVALSPATSAAVSARSRRAPLNANVSGLFGSWSKCAGPRMCTWTIWLEVSPTLATTGNGRSSAHWAGATQAESEAKPATTSASTEGWSEVTHGAPQSKTVATTLSVRPAPSSLRRVFSIQVIVRVQAGRLAFCPGKQLSCFRSASSHTGLFSLQSASVTSANVKIIVSSRAATNSMTSLGSPPGLGSPLVTSSSP